VSESDSFIHEVSEEIRKDRMMRFLRRWGWLIGGAILLVVGAAAYNEWSKHADAEAAERAGDALRAALLEQDAGARAEKLGELAEAMPSTATLARLAEAGALLETGDRQAAAAALAAVGESGDTAPIYRDLAALQRVMILGPDMDLTERQATIQTLAADGAPFRLMALEQRALLSLETDDAAAAVVDLETILADPAAPEQLTARARQLMIAAGGATEAGPVTLTPNTDG
jgi:hypothetical protein